MVLRLLLTQMRDSRAQAWRCWRCGRAARKLGPVDPDQDPHRRLKFECVDTTTSCTASPNCIGTDHTR
jgi:hypothetical protein